MNPQTDASLPAELLEQEQTLQFDHFTNEDALAIGLELIAEAQNRGASVTVDITRSGQRLFHFAMSGTAPDNAEWIRRKNNVVQRFGHSSYYIGTLLKQSDLTMEQKYLISSHEFAAHGGAFPIIIRNVGVVGTITVSGLPQREDHALVVYVLTQALTRQV